LQDNQPEVTSKSVPQNALLKINSLQDNQPEVTQLTQTVAKDEKPATNKAQASAPAMPQVSPALKTSEHTITEQQNDVEATSPRLQPQNKADLNPTKTPNQAEQPEEQVRHASTSAHLSNAQARVLTSNQQQTNPAIFNEAAAVSTSRTVGSVASSGTQPDFSSGQQDADVMLLDVLKTEQKGSKGLDFQAQLAYKSQRSFSPADTMLEIVRHAKNGSTSLELQLEPAHLGKVHISLQLDAAKQIQVMVTVDQQTSRQALEQHLPQLRLALAQQGLDLGSFSMQMNQQQHGEQHTGSSEQHDSEQNNTAQEQHLQEDVVRTGINLATDGHLSILA
ncbi:MAG: flagellar hook-length control protein FliK, partial [Mariprofundaceae bacterium]|nr:flagellar hook-length control protein FliK [Mariprofundaceae bacterium]